MLVNNDMTHHLGRPGDHLMTHFQCEVCHFSNVQLSNPMINRLENYISLCTIWRATLNPFWSQRPGMVKNNLIILKRIYEVGDEVLGLVEGLPYLVPFPLRD